MFFCYNHLYQPYMFRNIFMANGIKTPLCLFRLLLFLPQPRVLFIQVKNELKVYPFQLLFRLYEQMNLKGGKSMYNSAKEVTLKVSEDIFPTEAWELIS